jgi:putative flippase GtrA
MFNGRSLLRFIAYAGVGALGTAAQYGVLVAMVSVGRVEPVAGSVTGAIVGAVVNYLLNRRITFRSGTSHRATLPKFAATAGLGVLVNGLVMKVLAQDNQVNYIFSQLLATGLVLILTFFINSIWTFKPRREPNGAGL